MGSPSEQVVASPLTTARTFPWVPVLWYGALLLALYFPVLREMAVEWAEDESMGHGFFVPLVAGYIVWQRRAQLEQIEAKPSWMGWVLLVVGFLQLLAGWLGADFFMMRTSFLVSLVGLLVATGGFPLLKALAFPLVLLLFMIRIPLFIYSQMTFPLQIFASRVAAWVLELIGIPVLRDGNILELPSQRLSVVEACSGIRSLLSLTFLSLVYGYFFETRTWMKAVLFLSTIPIAIGANAFRVTLTGILSEWNPELATGAYHTMEGWVIFLIAMVALVAVHGCLNFAVRVLEKRKANHA